MKTKLRKDKNFRGDGPYNLRPLQTTLQTTPIMSLCTGVVGAKRKLIPAYHVEPYAYYVLELEPTRNSHRPCRSCIWKFSLLEEPAFPEECNNKEHVKPQLFIENACGYHKVFEWDRQIIMNDVCKKVSIRIDTRNRRCKVCDVVWLEIVYEGCGDKYARTEVPLVIV